MNSRFYKPSFINELCNEIEEFDELILRLELMREEQPYNYFLTSKLGDAYYYTGDLVSARKIFNGLTKVDSDIFNSIGYCGLARISKKNFDYMKALEYIDMIDTGEDVIAKGLWQKGNILINLGKIDEAIEALTESLNHVNLVTEPSKDLIDRLKIRPYVSLVSCYMIKKEYDKAYYYETKFEELFHGMKYYIDSKEKIERNMFYIKYRCGLLTQEEIDAENEKYYYNRVLTNDDNPEVKEHLLRHFEQDEYISSSDKELIFDYIVNFNRDDYNMFVEGNTGKFYIEIPSFMKTKYYNFIEVVVFIDDVYKVITAYPVNKPVKYNRKEIEKKDSFKTLTKKSRVDSFYEKWEKK